MKKKTYTEEEFDNILAKVEQEFETLLNSKPEETEVVEAKTEETSEEIQATQKSEETIQASQPEEVVEKTEQSYEYDEDDKKEVEELYGSMEKNERLVHYQALKKSLGEDLEVEVKTEETQVEATQKSEKPVEEIQADKTDIDGLKKAEEEINTLKTENEDLKKSVQDLTAAMGNFFKKKPAPKRKVTTGLDYVAKSEGANPKGGEDIAGLSKTEITQRLSKKASDPQITSQDREAINEYCLNNGSLDSIRHLLQ